MLVITKAIYYLLALAAAVFAITVIMRQGRAEVVFLSFGQKVARSLKVGLMVGLLLLLLFLTLQVSAWDGAKPRIDISGVLALIGCMVIPFLLIAAVATYFQLVFMEFLIRRGLKK